MGTMRENKTEYDFDFDGYSPCWVEYESVGSFVQRLFAPVIGDHLLDIKGVVSQRGWEPDWPIVLEFSSVTIGINTKCSYLWAIDLWRHFRLRDQAEDNLLQLRFESIAQRIGLSTVLGSTLVRISWPRDRSYGQIQSILFRVGEHALRVFDAGDELGIEILKKIDNSSWIKLV